MKKIILCLTLSGLGTLTGLLLAQNPLITNQFTADPTARVFEGKIFVYPSHDINCGHNWFCMQDYHVFSSENLVDWTDHGMILSQEEINWVDSTRFSMWAPDCFERGGSYYFYFPAIADTNKSTFGMKVGVAISKNPYGPFIPEPAPIAGVSGIDPNVFVDKNGQAYLYWASRHQLSGARLKENMLELDGDPTPIKNLPEGMKEGPFVFERKGIYYFTFPHVIEKTEALVYAIGDDPLGPFEYKGIIMDEHPSGCWTNHHSIVQYKGQWYLFYHHNDLSPGFDKNRSVCADSLFFNEDGSIQKVIPTLRGVGITPATNRIQIDRYSQISERGTHIAFLDSSDTFKGWKVVFDTRGAWIRYNAVDLGNGDLKKIACRVFTEAGSSLEIKFGNSDSDPLNIDIPAGQDWQIVSTRVEDLPTGIRDITLMLKGSSKTEIDWIRFESVRL